MSLNPNSADPALEALVAAPQPAVVPAANSVPRQAEPERDEQKRGFKRQRESTQAANPGPKVEKIARYGCLRTKYYALLRTLPTSALPWKPPSGLRSYTVTHASTVPIAVNFKEEKFTVTCGRRTLSYTFGLHNGAPSAWERAMSKAAEWKRCPPPPPNQDANLEQGAQGAQPEQQQPAAVPAQAPPS